MNENENIMKEIEKTKKHTKWGCLILILLLLAPLILLITYITYNMKWKETELVTSPSPSGLYTITVVVKGESAFFGPSKVRIKSDFGHIDRVLNNDGAKLYPENVAVNWENDYEATITLYGDEQVPEIVKFHAEGDEPFETGSFDLGSFTFKTSDSPNLINIIEFREVSKSKGPEPHSTVKIYYGQRGAAELETFVEYIPSDVYTPDQFQVEWMNDEQAVVRIMQEGDNGEMFVEETIEIDVAE